MKRPIFLSLVLWLAFGCSATLFGQFQYFGLDGQIMGGSDAGPQVATALGWVKQVSAHHGFGVDLVFSKLLVANPGGNVQFPQYDRSYDANLIWTRRPLPSIAGRYRLFIGNSFFIGSNLQFGWIRERFFADRLPNYERYGYPIDPVYMDYSLLTPYFRLSFETGFIWNMGEILFGTFQGRIGVQVAKSRIPQFGSFHIDYDDLETFEPYQGTDVMGGIVLGMGVKL
ncbi:MAG: hypothetical protein KA293_09885 [Bacteroidia bacterium]|nr:hypothetical protein [Bacteroidia bacterium]